MSLAQRLQDDVRAAMKAKDAQRLPVLRSLLAAVKNAQIDKGKEPLTDPEVVTILQRAVKQRRESAELYRQGSRPELAAQEEAEIEVVESYLPRPLDEEELRAAVEAVIQELGASDAKDFGRVMKEVMARHAGRVDGKRAQTVIRERLG